MALGGTQATELPGDVPRADARRVQQRCVAEQADSRASGRERRSTATRVEADVIDPPLAAVRVDRERDADQVAAGRASGGPGEAALGRVPAAERTFEMVAELLARSHSSECTTSAFGAASGGALR
jgi:hypothetical protein